MTKINRVQEAIKRYGQEHLLDFYRELNENDKESLLDQILTIDFELIKTTLDKVNPEGIDAGVDQLSPLKGDNLDSLNEEDKKELLKLGTDALKLGKVGVYLVAGGQGTRLGHSGPKGTFDIGLPSKKSLFQLQVERMLYLSKENKRDIPLYIMTSEQNHNDTVNFFKENDFFGYKKDMIMFFKQEMMPSVNNEGKVFLEGKGRIAMSPNGNGGCFLALKESGALDDMKSKGVEYLFLYGIDNAIVRVADPYFIGYIIKTNKPGASKVVEKEKPEERVGILCYKNGKPAIVEYSEMPLELTELRDEDGKLSYSNANILNHILRVDFIETISNEPMPVHIAHKKISHIDKNGDVVQSDIPNGYKFEYFLFDIFEKLSDMAALEVKREEEFAPVKNKEGVDSPHSAREMILNLHGKWLSDAGANEGDNVEVSPLESYFGENLHDRCKK